MTQKKVRLALASACLLALTATACSSDDKTSDVASGVTDAGAADAPPAAAAALTISNNTFSPASVVAGTEFTITNNDSVGHTVTDDAGSFNVSVPGGGSETLTIPTAGTFSIHCNIHQSMHGTITVA
jgi:plastocyanin